MVMDMTPGDTADTFVLATFETSKGRLRKVMTRDTWIDPISCAQKRPEIKNLTIDQVQLKKSEIIIFN